MATSLKKIKTSKIAAFINTGTTDTPKWARIRKQGELKLSYNAETTEDAYIDSDTTETNLDRYAVSFEGELTAHAGDPVFDFIDDLRIARATDEDSEVQLLIVYTYKTDTAGAYKAELNKGSIQISEFGGEGGGGNSTLSYTCAFNGDPTITTATIGDTDDSGYTTITLGTASN